MDIATGPGSRLSVYDGNASELAIDLPVVVAPSFWLHIDLTLLGEDGCNGMPPGGVMESMMAVLLYDKPGGVPWAPPVCREFDQNNWLVAPLGYHAAGT